LKIQTHNMRLARIITFLFLSLIFNIIHLSELNAQSVTSKTNLSSIKSEQLSNEQIKLLMQKALDSGMSPSQIEALARAKGMSQAEIDKIKTRAEILNAIKSSGSKNGNSNQKVIPNQNIQYPTPAGKRLSSRIPAVDRKIFGFSLFTNPDLTFNPGVNIATPKDYQLGPGDILNIDVWGASQKSYQEIVSPEGKIIISKVGPVFVSGLTIGQATKKIKKYLTTIYSGLEKGNTFMEISLGGIRSIRVNIVGEVTLPGTYNLSSLASVFNAMYAAGGPSPDGSLRDVKIIRNNKTIASLDFYNFLLNGILKGNMRLQDEDIIFVSPYKDRVQIKGQVKRNLFFDMKPGETLEDLIHFSGGFTGKAYTRRIKIIRKTPLEKKILVVGNNQQDTTKLFNGDLVIVDSVLNRYQNRVLITGAIMMPGQYAVNKQTSLQNIISEANGFRLDAYKKRIVVYRLTKDLTRKALSVNLNNLINKGKQFILQREDSIYVPSLYDLKEKSTIQVNGQVSRPGVYPYTENIRLLDVLISAGGLLESAAGAHVNIARRIVDTLSGKNTNEISRSFSFKIYKNLELSDSAKNFILSPFDQVYVRKSPNYIPQQLVSISGEVNFPGKYSLNSRNERISELIQQAGNLTPLAYLKGASLIRMKKNGLLHQKALKTINSVNKKEKNRIISANQQYYIIGIDLEKILKHPGSMADLELQPGDSLQILKRSQTVTVSGAVYRPNVIPYQKGLLLSEYISSAGGFTKNAVRRNIYIIYANGSVKKTSNFLFFKLYPSVEPGAEIIIPAKKKNNGRMNVVTAVGLSSSMASLALVLLTIAKTIKPF